MTAGAATKRRTLWFFRTCHMNALSGPKENPMATTVDQFPDHIVEAAGRLCDSGLFSMMRPQAHAAICRALLAERDRCIEIATAAGVGDETIAKIRGSAAKPGSTN